MSKKTSYLAVFLIFIVAFSSVATAASCKTTCNNVSITSFTVSPASGTAPLKVGFHTTLSGNCTKVVYEVISQKSGKTLAACTSSCARCKNGVCNCAFNFLSAGTYDAKATVYGVDGCCVNKTIKSAVTVKSPACVPKVGASISKKTVKFADKSGAVVKAWYWNFGDGKISREKNPVHTYKKAGTYRGCMSIKCNNVWKTQCFSVRVK
jgi:PKD repeat protein